ncbi:MAG: hypothetical protein NTV86_22785 [Planctomycetota bacterium]|nr:hypothetical protein [Planctomycetota bacterium]
MDMGVGGFLAGTIETARTVSNVGMLIGSLLVLGGGLFALVTGRGIKLRGSGKVVAAGPTRVLGLIATALGAAFLIYAIAQFSK